MVSVKYIENKIVHLYKMKFYFLYLGCPLSLQHQLINLLVV